MSIKTSRNDVILEQLSSKLNGAVLSIENYGDYTLILSSDGAVSDEALQAALDEYTPVPVAVPDDALISRLVNLETEVRSIKERAAAATVTNADAAKVRDAISGPPVK